jgi:hypothetical protein
MGGVERLNSAMLREEATKTSDETRVEAILKAGTVGLKMGVKRSLAVDRMIGRN